MKKKLTRIVAILLTVAMFTADSSIAVLADETPEDQIPVVNEITEPETPEDPESEEPEVEEPEGENPEGEEPEAENPTGEEPVDGAGASALNNQEPVEEEPVLFESVVLEEAHGEPGRVMSNRFGAFANQSRTDYYRKYYNQLGTYGKRIYSYLEDHAEAFIDASRHINDPSEPEVDIPMLVLEDDIPNSSVNSKAREAADQVRYAYAAFDYDHPEIFWLQADAFKFDIWTLGTGTNTSEVMIDFNHVNGMNYTIYGDDLDDIADDRTEMNGNITTLRNAAQNENDIYDKVAVINDWLSNNNYYNRYYGVQTGDVSEKAYKSVSALTAQDPLTSAGDLGDNEAPVCEGYSRAFKIICDRIGLPCILVVGQGHMWNYVQNDDGVWYAVDVTWDDPKRDNEYLYTDTPDNRIHSYILVGSSTVVPPHTSTFQNDNHTPNGAYWVGGRVMPTPSISSTAYERYLGPNISNLTLTPGNGKYVITFNTDKPGKYYYVFKHTTSAYPDAYKVQELISSVENGKGTGTVTQAQANEGTVTIEAPNPPAGERYNFFLIEVTNEEYISQVLSVLDFEPLAYVGWKEENGKDYYFCPENYDRWEDNIVNGEHVNERGAMAKGACWVGRALYKFNDDGTLEKQWWRIRDLEIAAIPEDARGAVAENTLTRGTSYKLVYEYVPEVYDSHFMELTNDSTAITWTSSDPRTVSVDPDGTIHALKVSTTPVTITGVTGDDDNRYHPTGEIQITVTYPAGWFSVGADRFYGETANGTVTLAEGWKTFEGKRYYFYPANDTEHTPYSVATGYARIDGHYYEFGADGVLKDNAELNEGFVVLAGKTYFVENGAPITDQYRRIGNHYYGFDNNGVMYQDAYFKRVISGQTWYFYADEDGVLATGPRYTNLLGNRYFADNSYANLNNVPVCSMQQGILAVGAGSYYYSAITESAGDNGELIVNGGLRQYGYFEGDALQTGEHYYALPYGNTNAGMLQSGWIKVGNEWRLFRNADDQTSPFAEVDDAYHEGWVEVTETGNNYKRYYINSSGRTVTGWQTINGKRYYFNADGSAVTGIQTISNNTYYFGEHNDYGNPNDDYGVMKTGRVTVPPYTYFFNTSGIRQTGWQKDPVTQIWDYYDPANDGRSVAVVSDTAPNNTLNELYWYRMTVGTEHFYYYFNSNSSRVTGFQTIGGDRYWFNNVTGIENGRMVTGLRIISGNRYYFSENAADRGKMLIGLCTFVSDVDGETYTYYANTSGVLQTGWQKIDGIWRYFDRDLGYETTASIGVDYWSVAEGSDGNEYKYYFRNGTTMVTGRQLIDGRYYYFSENRNDDSLGRLITNDYVKIGSNLYHADANGILSLVTSGWYHINGSWKYVDNSNYLKTGWQTIDGNRYWFDNDGNMAEGAFTIGSYSYRTHAGEAGYDDQNAGICYINEWYSYHNDDDPDGAARRLQFYNSSGYRQTGWVSAYVDRKYKYYYLSPTDTEDGRYCIGDMYTGVNRIGNYTYVFDENGVNPRSETVTITENNVSRITAGMAGTYYTNGSGYVQTGWQKINDSWRYFNPATGKEEAANPDGGFMTVGTDTFYFTNGTSMVTGFKDIDGKRYFFFNDSRDQANYGKMAKGWFFVGNDKYYADETEGYLVSGLVQISGHYYLFNSKNILQTGWQVVDSNGADRRFFDNTKEKNDPLYGAQLTSIYRGNGYYETTIGGNTYYYRFVNNSMQTGWQTIDGGRYCFGTDGRLQTGLFKYSGTWYYTSETGSVGAALGRIVPGIITLSNGDTSHTYYFNTSGQVMKGWQTIDGKYYYFNPEEGADVGVMMYGRIKVGSQYYYTDPQGIRQTNRFINYCGETYYANSSGVLVTGWQTLRYTEDNISRRYYFDTEGRMLTGWQKIGNDWYYFNTDTQLPQKGSLATGNATISGETYCFNSNGIMQTGWQKINGTWSYFAGEEDLDKGNITAAQLGKRFYSEAALPADYWRQVDFGNGVTQWYYISGNSSVNKGWSSVRDADGVTRRYYFDPVTGQLMTGLLVISGTRYILPSRGQDIALRSGRQLVDGDYYFFNTSGQALNGWQKDNDDYYYYDPNGGRELHGDIIDSVGGVAVHAIKIGNNYYRLDDNGKRYGAIFANGYLTDANGMMQTGWQTIANGAINNRHYFDTTDCHMYRSEAARIGSSWYYFDANGVMQTGFVDDPDDGNTYYYNSSGVRQTGWQNIYDGTVYRKYYFDPAGGYLDSNTGRMKTGFADISNQRYCFAANGIMYTELQNNIAGEMYYFNTSGVLQTGWQKINDVWYYFATANDVKLGRVIPGKLGKRVQDLDGADPSWRRVTFENGQTAVFYIRNNSSVYRGWQTIDGRKYYFDTNGELATGSFAISNVRYYSDPDGAAHNGFVEETDGWHYYDAGGRMLTGWQSIKCADNVTRRYYLNANGVLYVGKKSLDGTYYFFNDDTTHYPGEGDQGVMMTGVVASTVNGNTYYANTSGVLQTGWQKINGNWDYYAMQEDVNSGLVSAGDYGKRFHHETEAPANYWRNIVFPGGARDYYINNNSSVYKNWQTITNVLNVSIRYYFDPQTGELWTGKRKIGSTYYDLPEKDEVLLTGLQQLSGTWYYLNSNGQIMTGWQTIEGTRHYFDPLSGAMQTGMITVSGSRYYLDADGIMQTGLLTIGGYDYYFNTSGVMQTGWQNVNTGVQTSRYYFDPATGRRMVNGFVTVGSSVYYLDANGIMQTGWIDVGIDRYYLNSSGVMLTGWQTISNGAVSNRYYFDPANGKLQKDCFVINGSSRYHVDPNGVMQTGLVAVGQDTYYFSTSGVMQTGWQTIASGNASNRYYFSPITGKMAKGFLILDDYRYYLNNDGIMQTGPQTGIAGDDYYFNTSGVMQTGWQKIDNEWKYYATKDDVSLRRVDPDKWGKLCTVAETAGSFWRTVTFDNNEHCLYYINNNSSVSKGWLTLNQGGVNRRYYFNPSGELMLGHFVISNTRYYANETGEYPGSIYTGFRVENGYRHYYNSNGGMVTGWQDITENGVNNRYYFDFDGKMMTGLITIGSTRFLLNDDPALGTVGALIKNLYCEMSGHNYMTNSSGVIQTGWQRFTANGNTTLRYFDPDNGQELYEINVTSPRDWYTVDNSKFYVENGNVSLGWKTINGKSYYFDPVSGKMVKGAVRISGTLYYFNNDGTLASGVTSEDGVYYFLNSNGTIRVGWITDGNKKYYADPSTGTLSIGFATIAGKNYYFNEEASRAGELVTGFFRVPDMGQSYYDDTDNASNMYYAYPDGRLHDSGWDTIVLNPSASDSQKWSYYFATDVVGQTPEGHDIKGEIATGDVLIDDDGGVTPLDPITNLTADAPTVDPGQYYRFDSETGARKKAILVFLGNYYGEADYDYNQWTNVVSNIRAKFSSEQFEVMESMANYMNPDRRFANEPADYYIVNSNRPADQSKLYTAGLTRYNPATTTFPMPASSHQPLSVDDESRVYVAGNDIASENGAGPDGHVDVYDVEMYSKDVYDKAVAKYGANNIALIGISSGGGICLSLCQYAAADEQPADTILLSPWLNLAMNKAEIERQVPRSSSGFLDVDTARYWAARYTRDFSDPELYSLPSAADEGPGVLYPFGSPLNGTDAQFAKLKNVVIYTGSCDPFSVDCRKVAEKASRNGGNVEFNNYSSMVHGYMFVYRTYGSAKETIRKAAWKIMTQQGM